MRIVLLSAGVRGIGSYCINLYQKLRADGHEVLLISERKWEKQPLESFYQARSFMLFGLIPIVYRPCALVREIVRFRPDIIHHHWPCGTMDVFFGLIARHKIPYLITFHVSLASKKSFLDWCWYHLYSFFRRRTRKADAINCISDFVQNQLRARIAIPENRIHRIYAGINEKLFHPGYRKRGVGNSSDGIRLLFVGEIMPEKGIDILVRSVIEATRVRKDISLTIVGRGPLETRLKIATRGCDNIHWTGFLTTREEIADLYANADATVLPTRWDEAFSLVPIESFSCGTPVIATARGGTPEQVTDGVTGYLLSDGSEETLTKLWLSLDIEKLTAMRGACRERVLSRHTIDKMGNAHEVLYRSVLESANRS